MTKLKQTTLLSFSGWKRNITPVQPRYRFYVIQKSTFLSNMRGLKRCMRCAEGRPHSEFVQFGTKKVMPWCLSCRRAYVNKRKR